MTKKISIAEDYTQYPGPRYKKLGKGSGEEFREQLLIPALENHEKVVIDLDGTRGFGSSFLEEAFGGTVRKGIALSEDKLILESKNDALIKRIWGYIKEA